MPAMALSATDPDTLTDFGITCLNLGVFYKSKNQFESAEHSLIKAIELFKKAGNEQELLNAEIRIARLYRYSMIDLDKAEDMHLKAFEVLNR